MRYSSAVGSGVQHSSGRVIALGRLMLAGLFLLAISLDRSQPAQLPTATYSLLFAYLAFAAAMVAVAWHGWWLDATLAGPAHAIDIGLFTLLVLLTEGYTSPFFTFFVFLLLSAAIRWGWRATTLTAALLTLLYLATGLLVISSGVPFELQRFIVRTGQLVILSLILIWFGANQWKRSSPVGYPTEAGADVSPFELGLAEAVHAANGASAILVWRDLGSQWTGSTLKEGQHRTMPKPGPMLIDPAATRPFLYRVDRPGSLTRDDGRNLREAPLSSLLDRTGAAAMEMTEGLGIPLRSSLGDGALFIEGIRGLSTDHLDIGDQIATDLLGRLQAHALLKAAEESAESRSRLSLARDLHDSIVQFLAGAAFRLEALKRSAGAGRDLLPELDELKRLMLQEQVELRAFITALREGPAISYADLTKDLQQLAIRIARQWDIKCTANLRPATVSIPSQLQRDITQIIREGAANAVRHANARMVEINVETTARGLELQLINDGSAYPSPNDPSALPRSLQERIGLAGGTLNVARGMGVTSLSVVMPLIERRP